MKFLLKTTLYTIIYGLTSLPILIAEKAFFGDPPDAHHPWAVHDRHRPQPEVVTPAVNVGDAPSDASVLFDGSNSSFESNWQHSTQVDRREKDWIVKDGYMLVVPGAGSIETVELFGDFQLHVEWSHTRAISGSGQGRGNSGIFLPGGVEVQILDNYNNPTYADGTVGALYGVMPPAVNALRPPGHWQSYDIIYRRPIIRHGEVLDPGSLTVFLNGVVVQDSTPIEGGGGWRKRKPHNREFPKVGPISFQDHKNPVRFRNVWCRPLRLRSYEGGLDGRISTDLVLNKRREIAECLRLDAAEQPYIKRMLLLFESVYYEADTTSLEQGKDLLKSFLYECQTASRETIKEKEETVKEVYRALKYMQRFGHFSKENSTIIAFEALMDDLEWK
ncbi:MAG: DUF1080 domain-containing protein [Verrucomicrobiota bacterium]|nr:DUF1080 domain-containing protein [Verrucomicrobiota bacterium]